MAYIELYGRNPDTLATAFDYPRSVIPMAKAPPLYLTLPAAASRIFGRTNLRMHEADDNTVALDPRSTYERTERWRGLGGLGSLGGKKWDDVWKFVDANKPAMYILLGGGLLVLLKLSKSIG